MRQSVGVFENHPEVPVRHLSRETLGLRIRMVVEGEGLGGNKLQVYSLEAEVSRRRGRQTDA